MDVHLASGRDESFRWGTIGAVSVAVLLVNLRAYDDLERCLQALNPHLEPADEVVIVDYESDDLQLQRVMAQCPRASAVVRADNRGFAAGVNLAATLSRARFLLLLNPDTELLGPVPRILREWLTVHPETGVVGPRLLNADGSLQPSARSFPGLSTVFAGRSTWLTRTFPHNWLSRRNMPGGSTRQPVDVDWVSGACLMTPREVFDRLHGLDESFFLYWEDADYCRRATAAGQRVTYVPIVTARHTGGACARHALARAIGEFHRSASYLYWKHRLPPGRLFSPLVRAGLYLRGRMCLHRALRNRMAADRRPSHAVVHEAPVRQPSESL